MTVTMRPRRHELYSTDGYHRSQAGLLIPHAARPHRDRLIGIDLFSGCGGFSCGFHSAGIHVAAAAEWDVWAAMTYLINLGSSRTRLVILGDKKRSEWGRAVERQAKSASTTGGPHPEFGSGWISSRPNEPACEVFYLGDVRELTGERILDDLDLERGDVGVVFGGPPCQGYSMAGKREVMDPRNSLVFDFMRLVCEVSPATFVMENVPGMASMVTPEGLPVIDALARIAEDGGFGTYEAIRRSLTASAGAGAAMRSVPVTRERGGSTRGMALDGRDRINGERTDDAEQLTLLGAS